MGSFSVPRLCRLALLAATAVAFAGRRDDYVCAQDAGDDGVTGWADEGDGNTIMCIEVFKLLLDNGGTTIQDGEIAAGTLHVNPKYANYANAMLKNALLTGQGITTAIDPRTGRVTLRTDGGAGKADNGELINLSLLLKLSIDSMASQLPPVCKDILIKRLVVSSGAGGGVGDPHLTTLDQVYYDFQEPGVFRLFESENLQVQVFQHKCTPMAYLGKRAPSCYQGVAVSFAGSVAKFFIADNNIMMGKGSNNLEWLSVHKLKGNTVGYRVLTKVDDATYVDVMLSRWINNYPLFNVALRVSPYFKSANVHGLLGNWNGVKSDDIKDNAVLAKLHGFSLTDNLFTCTDAGCDKFVSPPTTKDLNASSLPSQMSLLRQGFAPIAAADIPVSAFVPVLGSSMSTHRQRRTQTDEEEAEYTKHIQQRAQELCNQVFAQMATCQQYVTNTTNYIQAVCVGDSILVGDLSIVDNTKITYLRECRRELDALIEANTTSEAETATLLADRKAMSFGDLNACPSACNGRGSCLASACKCDLGTTGFACDLQV